MEILFSTSLLKVVFEKGERFEGRKLLIKGEALSWGFDIYPDTMKWLKPYENDFIDVNTRNWIVNKILETNFNTDFKILIEGKE